jgi:tetratricopeptide (TPR) repeat protein
MLTATTSLLNAQPSVSPSPTFEWLYEGRMLLIDGVPFLVIALRWWRKPGAGPLLSDTLGRLVKGVSHTGLPIARRLLPITLTATALIALGSIDHADKQGSVAEANPTVIAWQRTFGEAQRRFSAGDYEGTVLAVDQILVDRPGELSAVRLRVAANLDMRRYDDALPDLNRLVDDDPTSVDLVLERGSLYSQVQRSDHALADFWKVILLAPDNPAGYQGAGMVEFERGNLDAARLWLTRSRLLAPRDGQLARELAAVYACEGDITTAMALYDEAVRLNPRDAQTYADRAALLRKAGYPDATVSDLQKVLVLSGNLQQNQWAVRLLNSLTGLPARTRAE